MEGKWIKGSGTPREQYETYSGLGAPVENALQSEEPSFEKSWKGELAYADHY